MDKMRALEVLVCVVEHGSFSKAADTLGMSAVMVGKYIAALESEVGTRLIERSTRLQKLTAAGNAFYQQAKLTLAQLQHTFTVVEQLQAAPTGTLTISAPPSFGAQTIAPISAAFQALHPAVKIVLDLSNRRVDVLQEDIDIAIRIGTLHTDATVAKQLCSYRMAIGAAPAYLQHAGTPQNLDDLYQHRVLVHRLWHDLDPEQYPHLQALQLMQEQSTFVSNDGLALRSAAEAGAGIIVQPEVLLQDAFASGRLLRVLPHIALPEQPVHVLYAPHSKALPKVALFVPFLVQHITEYVQMA